MRFSRKVLATCAALYVFSQIFFLINIQFPRGVNFDEFHYVPSAKQFLALKPNQNWEHPPLAKEIMAVGIGVAGDRPIGWRIMSTIFGSLTLVGMYLGALALFRDRKIALWVALLTLMNQLLYVQARIGMLDTFMFAFIVWALAAFTATWASGEAAPPSANATGTKKGGKASPNLPAESNALTLKQTRWLLVLSGICLGLATACKWFGVIPWVLCIGWVIHARMLQHWQTSFGAKSPDDWYDASLWRGISFEEWVLYLGVIPLAAYFVTFFPYLLIDSPDYGFWKIFTTMQVKMWEGQERVVSSHPYMSTWTQWPTIKRPIWYAFDKEGSGAVRGVLLLGNPWVLWTGLIAIAVSIWGWVVERRRDAFLIATTYGAFFFSWAVIPRKVAFFYYYYPAGMVLSFALAYMFFRGPKSLRKPWIQWGFLAIAAGVFIYFFPISAALKIPAEEFRKWMWRSSWI